MSGRVKRALHAVHQAIRPGGAYHLDTYHALTPVRFQPCTAGSGRRLNLFIPNIERSRMYGGQKTAFRFFTALLDECGGDARILVEQPCDAHQLEVLREQYPDWQIVGAGEQSAAARQIVILDPDTRERAQLPVRPLDYFVYTYWTGAYALAQYEAFQREAFGRATPHIHLIQDFEPGFKAWSADYLLADSIYHQPNTIAVFNSVELKDWFDRLGYGFTSSYVFSPKLDPDIAKHLHDVPADHAHEKLLVFYGRPSIPRNCFPLIVNALNLLLTQHPEVSREWKILYWQQHRQDHTCGRAASADRRQDDTRRLRCADAPRKRRCFAHVLAAPELPAARNGGVRHHHDHEQFCHERPQRHPAHHLAGLTVHRRPCQCDLAGHAG